MTPTRYGSKSSEDKSKRHNFKWPDGDRSEGSVGVCRYCGCKMQYKRIGVREGLDRVYAKAGERTFTEKEPQCIRRPDAVEATAHKSPAKKKGNKRGASASAKKKATAKKPARSASPKKKAAPKQQPQQEAQATA